MREGCLHGFSGADKLGQKILPPLVTRPHFGDGRNQRVLYQNKRVGPGLQFRVQKGKHVFPVAVQNGLTQGFGGPAPTVPPQHRAARRLPLGIGGDEGFSVRIMSAKHAHGVHSLAQTRGRGIGDAGGQARAHGHAQKCGVEQFAGR